MYHALHFDLSPDSLRGALRIRVRGSLTSRTVPQLITFLERRAHLPDCPDLLLSLCGLQEIEPHALDEIMRSVADLNSRGLGPAITVDLPVSADASVVPRHVTDARQEWSHQSEMSQGAVREPDDGGVPVRTVMAPVRSTISTVQSLQEASERVSEGEDLVVLSLAHQPLGLIRQERLRAMMLHSEEDWRHKRCASLVETFADHVSVDAFLDDPSVAEAIRRCQEPEVGPLLVVDGDEAVGILDPDELHRHRSAELRAPQVRVDHSVRAGGER
ncbi:hypothetical protein [Nesterenkonia xinjiangensis]|uniref:CBS domain-containing protein n=1 Tax=Nesterenkonia xinjiangensis TaxID=225327 RepID=A0A7Z0GJD7_9MICC|nr:hypothetical protein [Nesterenkonia xinjiangensis]NYJ77069.1 hypothetical protein [Nesterenkonia xinjiangensis]